MVYRWRHGRVKHYVHCGLDCRQHVGVGVITALCYHALISIASCSETKTSGNSLALFGVVVHFMDVKGKVWQFLLSLPHHHESHSGHNISETFIVIAY